MTATFWGHWEDSGHLHTVLKMVPNIRKALKTY